MTLMRRLPILCAFVIMTYGGAIFATGEATACPPGHRIADTNDAAVLNNHVQVGSCYDPNDVNVGQKAEDAKRFLISRYNPGQRSSIGFGNPKVEGINGLNADFAVRVAKLLQDSPYFMTINSAVRTPQGQGSRNPNSNHIYGCAVDLQYTRDGTTSQDDCHSEACRWIEQNALNNPYKLHIRMKYAPEWNHIEPIDIAACRANKNGNPDIAAPSRTPSSYLSQALRDYLGGGQQGGALGDMGGGAGGNVPTGIQGFGGGASPYSAAQPAEGGLPGISQQPYGAAQPYASAIPAGGGSAGAVGGGAAGSVPAQTAVPAPIALSSGQARNPVSTLLDENNVPQGNNAFNLIGSIAYPTTTATATAVARTGAVPSPVVLNTATIRQITAEPAPNAVPSDAEGKGGRVALTAKPGASGVHTFPPAEAGGSDATFGSQAALAQTLERIKQVLLAIMDLLRPFRYARSGTSGNEVEGAE